MANPTKLSCTSELANTGVSAILVNSENRASNAVNEISTLPRGSMPGGCLPLAKCATETTTTCDGQISCGEESLFSTYPRNSWCQRRKGLSRGAMGRVQCHGTDYLGLTVRDGSHWHWHQYQHQHGSRWLFQKWEESPLRQDSTAWVLHCHQ